jgi:hypothetical protein
MHRLAALLLLFSGCGDDSTPNDASMDLSVSDLTSTCPQCQGPSKTLSELLLECQPYPNTTGCVTGTFVFTCTNSAGQQLYWAATETSCPTGLADFTACYYDPTTGAQLYCYHSTMTSGPDCVCGSAPMDDCAPSTTTQLCPFPDLGSAD